MTAFLHKNPDLLAVASRAIRHFRVFPKFYLASVFFSLSGVSTYSCSEHYGLACLSIPVADSKTRGFVYSAITSTLVRGPVANWEIIHFCFSCDPGRSINSTREATRVTI